MRVRIIFFLAISICANVSLLAKSFNIVGKISDKETGAPIDGVSLIINEIQLWAISDNDGIYKFSNVPKGDYILNVSCLGYAKEEVKISIDKDTCNLNFRLSPQNLTLKEIVITAQENRNNAASSYIIDKTALDHHQMSSVTDLSTLLPGGKTAINSDLTNSSSKKFEIRSSNGEMGNPSFMTAVEIDGIRLSNNSSFTETAGVDSRNIATNNIESVEVITGIPSVEYGDVASGIVKIKTQKGRSPLQISLGASPKTKNISIGKGIDLLSDRGIVNLSFERTSSTSNIASPHTTYIRNAFTAIYSNTFGKSSSIPLNLSATLSGNVGGYDSKADPDTFSDTYTKIKDNTVRGSFSANWLLQKPYITSIEVKSSLSYSDKKEDINTNKSSSVSTPVFHGKNEGYFVAEDIKENVSADIALIPAGYWYELQHRDDRPVESKTDIKLNHNINLGKINNKFLFGASFTSSSNKGRGVYYDDIFYTPTWREYRYDEIPSMNNLAFYGEYNFSAPLYIGDIKITAGIRKDITNVSESGYGTVGAWSPRFNFRYNIFNNPKNKTFKSLIIRGGIGDAVKLPSFAILYPQPSYKQQLTFAPGALGNGTSYYAYYVMPSNNLINANLKWQSTRQLEIGIDSKIGSINFSLTAYRNKGYNGYMNANSYSPFAYKFTDQKSLDGIFISNENRVYSVDKNSGIVTVSDKTGTYHSVELPYVERTTFRSEIYAENNSPTLREGIEWMADFGKIKSLYTSFRIDGNFYHYKGINKTVVSSVPSTAQTMANGQPYKYVGFYVGGTGVSNGSETKKINVNATISTHIPKVKMVASLRIESTLYNSTQYLSDNGSGTRGVVLDSRDDYTGTDYNIYNSEKYVAVYPSYYVSTDDMTTKIPFEEKFLWAKSNDITLYNELTKLISKSNTAYYFKANKLSPYFSANLNLSKELGKNFSLSFYANNFLNNLSRVKSTWNDTENTLYDSSRIPEFSYGISLKIKL
ncbi:MAG: TonB-dependent receptor [Bacteroidales bacterium]|nr:TonB-dependent receptor [Bacteroidales bacterium]